VTFVTRARPQLVAHPDGIEDLHTAWRRANEVFRTKLCEHTRDHFTDRTDAVREILLIHRGSQRTARVQARRRKVEEVACDALPDRREGISRKLFIEEERSAVGDGLHEDRRRPANQCWHTQQIAGSNVAHGDLAAVSGVHIDAQQAVHHDGQLFSVGFRIHSTAGREVDDSTTGD
jgi:hypothetical protein